MSENLQSHLFPKTKDKPEDSHEFLKGKAYLQAQIKETQIVLADPKKYKLKGNDITALQIKLESQVAALNQIDSIESDNQPSNKSETIQRIKSLRRGIKIKQPKTSSSNRDKQETTYVRTVEDAVLDHNEKNIRPRDQISLIVSEPNELDFLSRVIKNRK